MRKKRIAISRDVGTALSITLQIAFSSSVASKFQQKERGKKERKEKEKEKWNYTRVCSRTCYKGSGSK